MGGRARPRGQRGAHYGHAACWLGDLGVAAGEDQLLLRGFAVSLGRMHLLTGNGRTVPLAGRGPYFGFGLGSLAGRLLGALGLLLLLRDMVLAAGAGAGAKQIVQDVRGSLLEVHLARAQCLFRMAQNLLSGHLTFWSARSL